MRIQFDNVQGVVVHRYRRPAARHLVFRFGGEAGARTFVRRLLPRITMADCPLDSAPDPLLNVGITAPGLRTLGVRESVLATLDAVYRKGPEPGPLGDVPGSCSDPARWWEGQFTTQEVHCIVHLHARSKDALQLSSTEIRDLARGAGVTELIPRGDGTVLDAHSLGGGKLHFGYTDGISHPDISWDDASTTPGQQDFRHFLLGYSTTAISSAPPPGPAADLVRDSSYGAFRWIYQDVATFNEFLRTHGPELFPQLPQVDAAELLAAKLMGRWRDGTPLVLSPDRPDPTLAAANDFAYGQQDPHGYRCPFSAHIRVVNPRDQQLDPVVVDGVPSVIRRGMPYGPPLESAQDDRVDRGVIGLFLCSDLRRQVYTLTDWMKQNDFSPVYDGNRRVQDPLMGNRTAPGTEATFILPGQRGTKSIRNLPDFVHTKGTVFLLYPSRTSLQQLAVQS
jgi:deferrochelatase/peroxidase EfeB